MGVPRGVSRYHREQVTLASAGKAHTVIVSVENVPQRSRGSGWAPPVAPPPTKPSAGSGKSADSVFQCVHLLLSCCCGVG